MGGVSIDDDVVRALLGAPRSEVQHEIADAVAVGDARGCFETVNRLVQGGQDLRQITAEILAHFRNLLIVKAAPGQEDLLDIQSDTYETLRIQADKFTPGELARVIALLLSAQNDMRWTTSPRLSLELALVRATIPDTDPSPAGTLSRLERLERLANLEPGTVVPSADINDGGVPTPSRGVPARRSISRTAVTGTTPSSLVRRMRTAGPCGSTRLYRMISGIAVKVHNPDPTVSVRPAM